MPKLLSENYVILVKQAFYYPQTDIENYYLNQLNKYHEENSNFIQGILDALSRWEDILFQGIPNTYVWEEDEQGKKKFPSKESVFVPLLPHLGITGHINMDFFKMHKETIGRIWELIILTKEVKEVEALYTKKQLAYLNSMSTFPMVYDFELLSKRLNTHKELKNSIKINKGKFKPNKFRDLFNDRYLANVYDFIRILHIPEHTVVQIKNGKSDVNKELAPLINAEGVWIGNCQAARVYYEALLEKNIVKNVARNTYAASFNQMFRIDASFVSQKPGDSAIDYKDYFSNEIQNVLNKMT